MELGGSQIEKCTDRPIGIYWLYSYRLKFFSSNVKLARDLITDDRSRNKAQQANDASMGILST